MKKLILLCTALLFKLQIGFAQTSPNVNVTSQVLPPYSTYLPDYLNSPNRVLVTLLSFSNVNVKLKITLTGDNGISVATSDSYRPVSPIALQAYQQRMLTGIDLKTYLDVNSIVVSGINKNDLFRGSGIPEGNYTLCVQVLDYNTGAALSQPAPIGCSNTFQILQILPPQLVTPRCDDVITQSNVQNIVFTWLPSPGARPNAQYKLKIVEIIPSNRNPNEAMNSATTPVFFETITNIPSFVYGPAQPKLRTDRKYAWRVTLLASEIRGGVASNDVQNIQNKGNSEVCVFQVNNNTTSNFPILIVSNPSSQVSSKMKLISPINGEKINAGQIVSFKWTNSSVRNVHEYRIQSIEIKKKSDVEKVNLFSNDLNGSISCTTNEFSFQNNIQTKDGLLAWRVVAIDKQGKILDKSNVDYYETLADKSELANLKTLKINDYLIQINNITSADKDNFSGSGTILLWEKGHSISVNFKNLKLSPVFYNAKAKVYNWVVTSGVVESKTLSNKVWLETHTHSEGEFMATMSEFKATANLKGEYNKQLNVFITEKDEGISACKLRLKWDTPFLDKYSSGKYYSFETKEPQEIKVSFKNKLEGNVFLKGGKMMNVRRNGIEVVFDETIGIKVVINKLIAQNSLKGEVKFPNATPVVAIGNAMPKFTNLVIPFENQKNLNFDTTFSNPIQFKINQDNSANAYINKAYIKLSFSGQIDEKFKSYPPGLNFNEFGVKILFDKSNTSQKPVFFTFDKVIHDGTCYKNYSKSETKSESEVSIGGFKTKLDNSLFFLNNNQLSMLLIKGNLFIPFINDWAKLYVEVDKNKLQGMDLAFSSDKKYYLQNNGGNYAYITLHGGKLEGTSVVLYPNLTLKNAQSKGVESDGMELCNLYVASDGAISFNQNFEPNSESSCEGSKKAATYYNFSFQIDKMKIIRDANKYNANFSFIGDVILGQQFATNSKKEAGFKYLGKKFDPSQSISNQGPNLGNDPIKPTIGNIKGGPSDNQGYYSAVENNIEISDDGKEFQASYEDGAQKLGGGFKIKTNDPIWGNYFELGGEYIVKQPDTKELSAKMIVGKTGANNGKYTYWFVEFKQKGHITVPVVPGILEIHGFGGKSYYHMKPTYDNLGKITNLVPDKSLSLGIVAEAYARTAYDQGRTLHGSAIIVLEFKNWGIKGIDYYLKGDMMAENSESNGLIQARLRGSLNWVDKYLSGKGQVWGKVADIVCINEGLVNDDSILFNFGANDFYMYVGTKENPIITEVMCGSGLKMGVYFGFDKKRVAVGMAEYYDSGWKGIDIGVASAKAKLATTFTADLLVNYSPFQATGTASMNGSASAEGCVKYIGCVGGSVSAGANLIATMPNPVEFKGSVYVKVSRWLPKFNLNASWSSNNGFNIGL